ncbi:hypothetical protein ACYCS5_11615 [Paenibacillus sp. SEL3]|uniref:Uncharacterized protein n=1 Tax=Paenibacillus polymyxa TaxID=1406 RepID=A0A8I1IZX9_PAEPO|nr:hypothetical protein [Paenibacillus polymyxa]MBM0636273.1 hypothetical protein [Paenibacillus polymyxa]
MNVVPLCFRTYLLHKKQIIRLWRPVTGTNRHALVTSAFDANEGSGARLPGAFPPQVNWTALSLGFPLDRPLWQMPLCSVLLLFAAFTRKYQSVSMESL